MIHKLYKVKNGWIHSSQNFIPSDPDECLIFYSLKDFVDYFSETRQAPKKPSIRNSTKQEEKKHATDNKRK